MHLKMTMKSGIAGALLLAAGCASRDEGSALSSPPRSATGIGTETRWLTPRAILEDYAYPPATCRDRFRVTNAETVWNITFPKTGYAYAGIVLRRTSNLAAARTRTRLEFRIKPGHAAARMSAGLVDGHGVVVDIAAGRPENFRSDGWTTVSLPLSSFPDHGVATGTETGAAMTTFDWSAVREFRLISSGDMPNEVVEVGMLRLIQE